MSRRPCLDGSPARDVVSRRPLAEPGRTCLNARLVVFLLVAVSLAGCAAPARPQLLVFDGEMPAALGSNPDDVAIAQTSARLMRETLGLPFPSDTKIHVYVNRATLAEGLVREGSLKPDVAWEKARFAAGVATRRGLFLRGDLIAGMPLLDRVALIAHELTHVCQMELRRGGQGSPAVWIREGHADWVKFRVLEWLQIRSYADSRAEAQRRILRSTTPIRFFPDLTALRDSTSWDDATNRFGGVATYGQAFLAIDWLVERDGIEKLHEFLRRFALAGDPRTHWAEVYAIPYAQFNEEFRARLEALRR